MDGKTYKYDELRSAFYRVGLLVDQTWWNDKDFSDGYKLANLGLWNEVIQSNETLGCSSEEWPEIRNHMAMKNKRVFPTCRMDVAQKNRALMDTKALPTNSFTQVPSWQFSFHNINLPPDDQQEERHLPKFSQRQGASQKDANPQPYSIETMEELMIHQRIASPSVKNVWANDSEKILFSKSNELDCAVWGTGLNTNAPEFFPSAILPRQCPRYSNIFGANYQAEVFPYNDDKMFEKKDAHNIKHRENRRQGTPVGIQQNENIFWLQNIYPHRMRELSKLEDIARHLETITRQIAQPFSPNAVPAAPASFVSSYRDVLTKKIEDPRIGKEESDPSPFDELERQALEQYQPSETCLVTNNITSDPVASKFQDLEREALEQYAEDCEDQLNSSAEALDTPTERSGRCQFKSSNATNSASLLLKDGEQSKKKNRKTRKRQLAEEQKISNKQAQTCSIVTAEEEIRQLATNLKYKVLTYLRSVDLRITQENRKTHLKSKDSLDNPIQRRIRVSDINDLDTYRTYIREVSLRARVNLLQYFKRIRSEIMESSSRGMVSYVRPSTCEKRNVKRIIKKCLELKNHAETMSDIPRNLLNGVKREATDTLDLVHHTMEVIGSYPAAVIYHLSNMSKQASKDVEELENGKTLYLEDTALKDTPANINHWVLYEERKPGILFDRDLESLNTTKTWSIYLGHVELSVEHQLSLRNLFSPICEVTTHKVPFRSPSVRVNNTFWFHNMKMESQDIWSSRNWTHVLQVGEETAPTRVTFSSTCRELEHFSWAALKMVHSVESRAHRRRDDSRITRGDSTSPRKRRQTRR